MTLTTRFLCMIFSVAVCRGAVAAPVEPLFGYKPVSKAVTGIAISPDGATLAVSYDNNTLHLLGFKSGKDIAELDISGGPNCLRFTPSGKILLAITNGGVASIDVQARQIKHLFKSEAPGGVTSIDVSPDGKVFACSGRSSVAVWNIETGVNLSTIDAHTGNAVNSVAFSPDGSLIASGGNDKKIIVWNATTAAEQKSFDLPSKPLCVVFAPDGDSIMASFDDRTFHQVDAQNGDDKAIAAPALPLQTFCLSKDGTTAFIAGTGPEPCVLLINKKRLTTQKFAGHHNKITAIAMSADGRFFACGDQEGQINVYPVMEAAK